MATFIILQSQDPSRNSSRKRAFFRNFRRTSVRYSSRRRKKRKLKATKSSVNNPIKLSTPLRKSYSSDLDYVDGFSLVGEKGKLFGRLLEDICDKDELPPKSIFKNVKIRRQILLQDLTRRGPSEFGVFRKSGNARIVRELKASLDREEELILTSNTPVTIVASLFKDFIRSLPNCLFCSELYDQWMELCSISNKEKKVQTAQHLCSLIPGSHRILVKLLLYVLNLIAAKSEFNKMTPDNLGICLGPSILNTGKEDVSYDPKVSEVLSFMITNFDEVFGENDKMKLESLLLGEISKEPQEDEAGEYSEQFLSETTKHSGVSSSIDSGICSGVEDNYYSDVPYSNHSTPVSIPSRESKVSTDEVDTRLNNVGFKRNNWMRKGVMKKRNSSKDVKTTVEIVSIYK
ncbi:Rho GTPase-activating protein 20 [Armadillidium nasatum]|uniref:Rho GTPase-activating protein 20 n=1 Tax=Armadillidium nasatum TaxID=96803 RepID=A0A5N5SVX2_9CRUS|nr:Rho GTPase-activating protein 20 [Armadillidium nasatum]